MHYFSNLFDKVLCIFRTDLLSEICRVLCQINLKNECISLAFIIRVFKVAYFLF